MERQYNIKGASVETFEMINENAGGKRRSYQLEQIRDTVYTESEEVSVRLAIVDTYVTDNDVYFLCTVPDPKTGTIRYDDLEITTQYGTHALWRSIIPGWGQFYKGCYLKGGMLIGGCAILAGGIVATENIRADYARKIGETHEIEYRKLYAKRVDQFSTVRNVCIGALGAVYLYNLIDAVASPGARRVVVRQKGRNHSSFSWNIYPTSHSGQSLELALNISF